MMQQEPERYKLEPGKEKERRMMESLQERCKVQPGQERCMMKS